MKIIPQSIEDVFLIRPDIHSDERGQFLKLYDDEKLASVLDFKVRQINRSFNRRKGTFRGLHYQAPPFTEAKIVSCIKGSVSDVILDLRSSSASFMCHAIIELTAEKADMLYLPAGIAHGFISLEDHTEMLYLHDGDYVAGADAGVNILDPVTGIVLPLSIECISDKDKNLPYLSPDFRGI